MKEGEEELQSSSLPAAASKRGRMWSMMGLLGSLFSRGSKNDFEKRLQHLTKEEVVVHTRLKRRTQKWRNLARAMIVYFILGEAFALGFAVLSTRTADLPWQVRAIRALPVFALPAAVTLLYSTCAGYNRMMERKDKERLERLKAERQEKINELKEKTNYYVTQQLIQQYDPDPAAKAAAASILASKLGAESGLNLAYVAGLVSKDDLAAEGSNPNEVALPGGSPGAELLQSTADSGCGLRHRKPQYRHESVGPVQRIERFALEKNLPGGMETRTEVWSDQGMAVKLPQNQASAGGWIARLAAMLVGEDPTQCYALICKKCHAHNGLAKKEDHHYIQYYCPHCRTLNGAGPARDGLRLTDELRELPPKLEQSKALSSVEGSRSTEPDFFSNAAPVTAPAPPLSSQLIIDKLDRAGRSEESN